MGALTDDPAADYLRRLPRNMVQNTMKILDHEDAILKRDPDIFEVLSLRTPSRRVRVLRRGDSWRCRVDKKSNQEQPCSHILAVLIYEGHVELPSTAAAVWSKGKDGRNHTAEDKAWRIMHVRFPQLLRDLLNEGLPVIAPEPPPKRGRPVRPMYPKVFQAITRVFSRQSVRSVESAMASLDAQAYNPYGPVKRSTFLDFMAQTDEAVLEKFLALSSAPARPYETLAHPDGTGLTEQHFGAFFDEKYKGKKGDQDLPRTHRWSFVTILWSYRYTMIAALRTQQGPFGEAPWLIPLLERAAIMFDLGELGGDKAYNSYAIDAYLAAHGIDSQIKVKANANPRNSYHGNKAFKRRVEESRLDPDGFAAKANRRNNAETGNRAFKAILGDQIFCKSARAQRNEILCMAIAYNLTRLVFLEVERGIQVSFRDGAARLAAGPWASLDDLRSRVTGSAPASS